MNTFTTENLLSYLYNELTTKEQTQIKKALDKSWVLREKLQVLKESKQRMNKIELKNPSAKSVEYILQYAQKTTTEISST